MELGLSGKVAAITGGSRGIGRAIALSLAREGCDISICGRTREALNDAVEGIQELGVRGMGYTTDVTEPETIEGFIGKTAEEFGKLDLLVANVGATVGGALLESTPQEWVHTFELNVLHASRAVRAAVPYMRESGAGAVVIIASISGWKPSPKAQYGASKAAEIYLAGALARELGTDGIRVNAVSPGSIMVPGGGWDSYRQRDPERFREFEERDFPARRLGRADEVADVVAFLLSERAAWINGANICVDGGQGRPSALAW